MLSRGWHAKVIPMHYNGVSCLRNAQFLHTHTHTPFLPSHRLIHAHSQKHTHIHTQAWTNGNRDQSLFRTAASRYWWTDPHLFIYLGPREFLPVLILNWTSRFLSRCLTNWLTRRCTTKINYLVKVTQQREKQSIFKAGFGYRESVYYPQLGGPL